MSGNTGRATAHYTRRQNRFAGLSRAHWTGRLRYACITVRVGGRWLTASLERTNAGNTLAIGTAENPRNIIFTRAPDLDQPGWKPL